MPELKVFPVSELVTYGFNASVGRLEAGGKHLSPEEYHKQMTHPNTIMVDVRNFNETAIGKFAPPGVTVCPPTPAFAIFVWWYATTRYNAVCNRTLYHLV
jgi:predicted sulfurtransferase